MSNHKDNSLYIFPLEQLDHFLTDFTQKRVNHIQEMMESYDKNRGYRKSHYYLRPIPHAGETQIAVRSDNIIEVLNGPKNKWEMFEVAEDIPDELNGQSLTEYKYDFYNLNDSGIHFNINNILPTPAKPEEVLPLKGLFSVQIADWGSAVEKQKQSLLNLLKRHGREIRYEDEGRLSVTVAAVNQYLAYQKQSVPSQDLAADQEPDTSPVETSCEQKNMDMPSLAADDMQPDPIKQMALALSKLDMPSNSLPLSKNGISDLERLFLDIYQRQQSHDVVYLDDLVSSKNAVQKIAVTSNIVALVKRGYVQKSIEGNEVTYKVVRTLSHRAEKLEAMFRAKEQADLQDAIKAQIASGSSGTDYTPDTPIEIMEANMPKKTIKNLHFFSQDENNPSSVEKTVSPRVNKTTVSSTENDSKLQQEQEQPPPVQTQGDQPEMQSDSADSVQESPDVQPLPSQTQVSPMTTIVYLTGNQAVPFEKMVAGENDYIRISRYSGKVKIHKGPDMTIEGDDINVMTFNFKQVDAKIHFEFMQQAEDDKAVKVTLVKGNDLQQDPLYFYENLADVILKASESPVPNAPEVVERNDMSDIQLNLYTDRSHIRHETEKLRERAMFIDALLPLIKGFTPAP